MTQTQGDNMRIRIEEFVNKFEVKTRKNGDEYVVYNGSSDFIQLVHGTEFLPDDFRFRTIYALADEFLYYDFDDLEELIHNGSINEIVGGLVSIYNHELLAWVSSHLLRPDYVSVAVNEFGDSKNFDFMRSLALGQYMEINELAQNLIAALESDNEL
jgi:hypothetical protein